MPLKKTIKKSFAILSLLILISSLTIYLGSFVENKSIAARKEPQMQADDKLDLSSCTITSSGVTGNTATIIDGNTGTGVFFNTESWLKISCSQTLTVSKAREYIHEEISLTHPSQGATIGNCPGTTCWQEKEYSPNVETTYFYLLHDATMAIGSADLYEFEAYGTASGPGPEPGPGPDPGPGPGPGPTPPDEPEEEPEPPSEPDPGDTIEEPDERLNITLEVPNGGEEWFLDEEYDIKWRSTDEDKKIKKIALYLSKDGGENYKYLLAKNLKNNGQNSWHIPEEETYITDEAKILVAAFDNKHQKPLIADVSDEVFQIKPRSIEAFISDGGINSLLLQILALAFLIISGGAVFWPSLLNLIANSPLLSSLLNKLYFLPFFMKKKGAKWGIVYDSFTKKPIANVLVRLFEANSKKLKDTTLTNQNGEFSFLVPEGKFYLRLSAQEHKFPSTALLKKLKPALYKRRQEIEDFYGFFMPEITDKHYDNLYFGEIINNKWRSLERMGRKNPYDRSPLKINIPLDREKSLNLNQKLLASLKVLERILMIIKWPLLILGLLLSAVIFVFSPSIYNLVILELYLILIAYELSYRAKERPFGEVKNKEDKPLSLSLIRARGFRSKKIRATSISGEDGKFTLQLDPGWYKIEASKNDYQKESHFTKLRSARELGGLNFKLKRILPE